MMRITRIAASEGPESLRVEGRLTQETVEELRMACDSVLAERKRVKLDVSGLQFIDPRGVVLLRGLEQDGAEVSGGSGFVTELLRGPVPEPATSDGESALVARLRANDPEAFEVLVRRYGARMLALARRFVGNDENARDVVQEAFLAAFRSIDGFAGAARLSTWLHRIVVNTALMKLRSRRRRPEEPIDDLLPRFDETGHWSEPPSEWETPAETLAGRRETRAIVRRAIDRLPAAYRSVLLLRDIEERDMNETAELLGITPNAAKVRLHRARQALRTLLERELAAPKRRAVPA
jgi:RNA polymerase sigma-70 factor (ECF subfamily)